MDRARSVAGPGFVLDLKLGRRVDGLRQILSSLRGTFRLPSLLFPSPFLAETPLPACPHRLSYANPYRLTALRELIVA